MSINVQHAANPSVVLGASFGAGQAEARRRAQLEAAQALERQGTREDQQAFQREMIGGDQASRLEAEKRQRDFQREMTAGGQGFQREMGDTQFENQLQLMREREALGEGEFEFRLTAQQKAEQEKLTNALQEINASQDYTDEEKGEARRRIVAQLGGIQPLPMRKDPSKYPQGQDVGQTWNTTEGLVLTRMPDGSLKKIGESRTQPTYQDKLKAWDIAIKTATTKDEKTLTEKVDMAEAKKVYGQIMGTTKSGLTAEDNFGLGPNPKPEDVYGLRGGQTPGGPPAPAGQSAAVPAPTVEKARQMRAEAALGRIESSKKLDRQSFWDVMDIDPRVQSGGTNAGREVYNLFASPPSFSGGEKNMPLVSTAYGRGAIAKLTAVQRVALYQAMKRAGMEALLTEPQDSPAFKAAMQRMGS